jgi:hypothetical protein
MKSHGMNWLQGCLAAAVIAAGGAAQAQVRYASGPEAGMTPASPLAGGMAAAVGGDFVDVHGNSIVMPANYCQPAGCMGDPSGGMCGCGECETGYADFGGYSQPDQCGPHYFDVAVGIVFLQGEDLFAGTPALGSIGVQGPRILDPNNTYNDYEPGWHIALRHDLGPLSILEATYFGIYDLGFTDSVRSVDVAPGGVDYQLNSVFSDYGVSPIDGLDEGSVYSLEYDASLQSTELSYRRYWVGYNPRISGTYLLGARYLRLAEDLAFNALALNGTSSIVSHGSNDMVGFQCGGDGWIALRQGLRLGGECKTGVYNNRFEYSRSSSLIPTAGAATATVAGSDGNQVAFAAEASLDVVADVLPSWSIRGGYKILYMNNLATVGGNSPSSFASTAVGSQSDALFHGFTGGLEYIW